MQQLSYDGADPEVENRPWRIPPGWLIQIEAAWLIASALIGWQLSLLPPEAWGAQLYRHGPGGNALGLFALGNAVGYLTYEEVRMVFSGMFHREKVADIKARESKFAAERAKARAELEALVDAAVSREVADKVTPAVDAARAAAMAEARQQERAAVAAWYERQQAAQREGRPFDEPPPGYVNGDKAGSPVG